MNPQTYNPGPATRPPAPQAYGAGAQPRAMMAAHPSMQPIQAATVQQAAAAQAQAQAAPQVIPNATAPGQMPSVVVAPTAPAQTQTPIVPGQATPIQAIQPQMVTQPIMQPQQAVATSGAQPTGVEPSGAIEAPLSTQATLQFSELRDSLVIMKDGSFRAVVACQSINFDLMSETEREGVEYSYQNFLNSLNFTTQILVRSQRVDIAPYIERLVKMRRNNDNMLLGVLMDDYINFIDVLAQEANIMDKSFFIVIPYYSSADMEQAVQQTKNFIKAFSKNSKQPTITRINRDTYNKAIDELNNRVETVISGLFQIGIQSVRLNTKELSQLFYNFNNPDTAVREPLVDFTKLATTYVRKGTKE